MSRAESPVVVFVAVPAALGGSNRALVTLLAALGDHVTRVVAAPGGGAFASVVRQRGLADEWIPLIRRREAGKLIRLLGAGRVAGWTIRNRGRIHAIHANATTGLYMAAPAALLSRRPLVVWVHDSVSTPWGKRLGRLVARLLPETRWVAVSETARDVVVQNGLAAADRVMIIPNPFDPEEIVSSRRASSGDGRLRVGFLGAATEAKGFDLLPDVMSLTADLSLVWKLFLSPEAAASHPAWQSMIGADHPAIEFLGRQPDVRQAYSQCDIVFNPSRTESFSRVTAEALMNGIPVVATDLPAIRDLIGDDTHLLFQAGSAEGAASAIRRAVERASIPVAPKPIEAFSPTAVARSFLEAYGVAG